MIYARRYKFIRILFVSENTCLYVFAVAISGIFVFVRVACVRDESRGAERALWHLIKISLNFLRFFSIYWDASANEAPSVLFLTFYDYYYYYLLRKCRILEFYFWLACYDDAENYNSLIDIHPTELHSHVLHRECDCSTFRSYLFIHWIFTFEDKSIERDRDDATWPKCACMCSSHKGEQW